jgi:putative PIN family toxin of toxin-antitoxin system
MIVVLDTNVIISAALSLKGAPAKIIRHWGAEEFEVVTSPPLISEFERVLSYSRVTRYLKLSKEEIDGLQKRFRAVATVVDPQFTLEVVKKDPADNRVLECAVAGEASYIVTGNTHLLELGECQQIVILKPAEFLTVLNLK